jgi:benzodiazapine receptor
MRRALSLTVSFLLAFGAGFIGSLVTTGAITAWYSTLAKPELNPPNWVFGPVWSILYAFMAVAAWRIWEKRKNKQAPQALVVYAVHLVINVLWSVAFFGFHAPMLALGVIVVLLLFVVYLTVSFYRIDRLAGLLFIPYLAWVLFAVYLNLSIALIN